jgi:hypothetical protein
MAVQMDIIGAADSFVQPREVLFYIFIEIFR